MMHDQAFWSAIRDSPQPVDFLAFADHLEEQGREWDALWARAQAWLLARKARGAAPVYIVEGQWDEYEIGGRTILVWSASGRLSLSWSSEYNECREERVYIPLTSSSLQPRGMWWLTTRGPCRQKSVHGPASDMDPFWGGQARDFYTRLLAWRRKAKPNLWPRPRCPRA